MTRIGKLFGAILLVLFVFLPPEPTRGQTLDACTRIENANERLRCLERPEFQEELNGRDACALLIAYAMDTRSITLNRNEIQEKVRLCRLSADCRDTADGIAQLNAQDIKLICIKR
jgi:hypothetical protein